jgi:DNA-binding response OmpR family regulator
MKILLVEDEARVGAFIKENLARENFAVTLLPTLPELEDFLEERPFRPDLIILDRLLENHDSRHYLSKIKQRLPDSRILFLSALNSPADKASLLDEGADDYLGKPFSLVELLARVRALLRRRSPGTDHSFYITVANLVMDLKQRSARCDGKKLDLTNKEYALLLNFAQNENKVFSKYQLLDIIWETNLDVESNVLEVTIMNLRRKLEEVETAVKILSKRNVGYWLEA